MLELATSRLPTRRPELVIRPLGAAGRYVVKDPAGGAYFQFGEEERFLLEQLDGTQDGEALRTAFEQRFGEPLSEQDLEGFVGLAGRQGFLRQPGERQRDGETERGREGETKAGPQSVSSDEPGVSPSPLLSFSPPSSSTRPRQSILAWRKSLCDPDRLFTWLEPRVRFFWTRAFLALTAL